MPNLANISEVTVGNSFDYNVPDAAFKHTDNNFYTLLSLNVTSDNNKIVIDHNTFHIPIGVYDPFTLATTITGILIGAQSTNVYSYKR